MASDGTCEKQSLENASRRDLLSSHFDVNLGIAGTGWPASATAKETFFPQDPEDGDWVQPGMAKATNKTSIRQFLIAIRSTGAFIRDKITPSTQLRQEERI